MHMVQQIERQNKIKASKPGNEKEEAVKDFELALYSRELSLAGRKEVLTGKAKFGIFGAGKEVAQIAMSKVFNKGDWHSGYYRDQTIAFAKGIASFEEFLFQLYADARIEKEPHSKGRQMNNHFQTRYIDENGNFKKQMDFYNSASDLAPTAGQMPKSLGLALASKFYRKDSALDKENNFSENGNEICFATIGDASCAEGMFWETLNAAGVLNIPLCISVWDDGYGISVPTHLQINKGSISATIKSFESEKDFEGISIYEAKGWDYKSLVETYKLATEKIRKTHKPALIHIKEITQPQGHSTSGSHERYKSQERLQWEKENDCILKMKQWLIEKKYSTADEIDDLEVSIKKHIREVKIKVYKEFLEPQREKLNELISIVNAFIQKSAQANAIKSVLDKVSKLKAIYKSDIAETAFEILKLVKDENIPEKQNLIKFKNDFYNFWKKDYQSDLINETATSALKVKEVKAAYSEASEKLNGYQILNKAFDIYLNNYPKMVAFGEDVGNIGDVNQGFAGMQEKYGENRVFDAGIRESTIIGQGIGLAMRGFKPIAEIQYFDYLPYALAPLTDDLATLSYRSAGGQFAPLIVRTRGHRLEGIWHTGSHLGLVLSSMRGVHICVPRNMVQAAGMYKTLLESNDCALVIESLNGYRLKETLPDNIGEFSVPLGKSEVLMQGSDITLVSYGSTLRIAQQAAELLAKHQISVELIDVQTLLPFDLDGTILKSLEKTNKLAIVDEDVPGGGSGFILQQILDVQNGYHHLDAKPVILSAVENRGAFGSDGDYFCKPNKEDIFEALYTTMHEYNPNKYKMFF